MLRFNGSIKYFAAIILLGVMMLPVAQASSIEDARYARILDVEAHVSNHKMADYVLVASSHKVKAAFDVNDFDVINGKLPADLSYSEFEKLLQENFMGSYIFFKRLDEAAQTEVYRQYTTNPSIEALRQHVIQLSRRKG